MSLTTTYQNAILKSSFGKTEDSSLPGTILYEGKQLQQCKEDDTMMNNISNFEISNDFDFETKRTRLNQNLARKILAKTIWPIYGKHSSNEERDLTKEEEESLVLAGNGFTFLVWFMKQPQNADKISLCDSNRTSLDLMEHEQKNNNELAITRQQIFSLMPYSKGKLYISNTLKAFSNYYHYSIGELSFAVVAPVRKLIIELERF